MPHRPDRPPSAEEAAIGFARAAAFFVTLTLIAILALIGSAQASTPFPESPLRLAAAEAEDEGRAEEEGDAEEEADETEWCMEEEGAEGWTEEGEEEGLEGCEEEAGASASEECMLASASAKVSAATEPGKVRLVLRYTTHSPTVMIVRYSLRGAKGSLNLGKDRQRFDRSGVFRDTEVLPDRQMAKVTAAREFTVELRAVNSPSYCRELFEQHLTARRSVPGGLLWTDPSADRSL